MSGIKAKAKFIKQFAGKEVVKIVIENEDLKEVNFVNKIFKDFVFNNCDFKGVDLSNTTFIDTRFNRCSMQNINLTNATLNNVAIWWSTLENATMEGTTLVDLHGQYINFNGVDFTKAIVINPFVWIGSFIGAKVLPEQGFRTKRGG